MRGKIVAISVSKRRGTIKTNVSSALLVAGHGIEGDAHAGEWPRQVSLLAEESIENMHVKGLKVSPGSFAENFTTSGIDLPVLEVGDRLRVGSEAELEISQIGKECHERCAIYDEVGDCVMPREGVFARVLRSGLVNVGDPINMVLSEEDQR